MREAVVALASRIGPRETWRMTVEKRAGAVLGPEEVIRVLAPLVPAAVNLTHPDKILLVELFGDSVAYEVLSIATVQVKTPPPMACIRSGRDDMNGLGVRQERADGDARPGTRVDAVWAQHGERVAVATADDRFDIELGQGRRDRRGPPDSSYPVMTLPARSFTRALLGHDSEG
jgi:hypothetical protein